MSDDFTIQLQVQLQERAAQLAPAAEEHRRILMALAQLGDQTKAVLSQNKKSSAATDTATATEPPSSEPDMRAAVPAPETDHNESEPADHSHAPMT